uniref:Uncharacterized protein n=1 Tax=Nicotiana tabacum TaxID=4097 RepID=A0A1S4D0H5_TOBAC|nr:PREDICTED: uncharacterized protein LOC107824653 [Nicotiana tabacum]
MGPIDPVILKFCRRYNICLGQFHPSPWRIMILLRFFVNKIDGCSFTIDHLLCLYSPRIFQRRLIKLVRRASKAPFSSINDDWDQCWQGHFVRVRTSEPVPAEWRSFPERWNASPLARVSNAIPRLKESGEGIVSQMPYSERSCRKLSKGRWEARSHGLPKNVELRPPIGDEDLPVESPALGQAGERKRRRALSSPSSEKNKPRRRLVRKPKESTSS